MLKKFIKNYYKLFDEKLENWTIIVLIIAFLITSIWNVTNAWNKSELYFKASLVDSKSINDIIIVNGKTYKMVN